MKRRFFLRDTVLGGLSVPFLATSCQTEAESSSGTTTDAQVTAGGDEFPLLEATVEELQAMMESGEHSARDITQLYLERIAAIDDAGPELNAVIETNPDALKIAERLDEERAAGKVRGPLHGIPVIIKDNIDTGDQMQTTAGTLVLEGHVAAKDAFIVAQMREAGAVLLGKANLSEWANFRSTRSSSGWSGRGGQTKNPYVLDRNPCGSSAGSGVAVSASLCAIAIGTETNGSIVCPSNANGVVGIKPTVGLWSRSGIIPISFTQDTAGPMGRCVRDAATLLGPLTGVDKADKKTAGSRQQLHKDYTPFLKEDGLNGARIGVMRDMMGFHEGVDRVMEAAFKLCVKKGLPL